MIGGMIGKAIGEVQPKSAVEVYLQTVTANVALTVSVVKSVSFTVSAAAISATVSVVKSVAFTVTAAAIALTSNASTQRRKTGSPLFRGVRGNTPRFYWKGRNNA